MMIRFGTAAVLAVTLLGGWMAPSPASAANATTPYKNVNKANDSGNDTGDSQVDKLNEAQLNSNYHGQNAPPSATTGGTMQTPPSR